MEFKEEVNQLPIDVEKAVRKRVSTRSFEARSFN